MDWNSPKWRDEAITWAGAQGISVSGEVTQPHLRPWSTALRLPTTEGIVWLKAGCPGTSYEAGLLQTLSAYDAPHVLRPLAVDAARGWVLLPDGGPTLRSALDRDPDLGMWERALVRYAELQRAVEGRPLPGADDQRPITMPGRLATLLDTVEVAADRLPELLRVPPRYGEWCEELTGSLVPMTLQHDDLHDNNVFAQLVFFDFGDAVLGHPFSSLLVTLRSVAGRWSLEPGAPELRRLRDAYLEAWTDLHSREELELLALLATRVGKVGRVLSWQRALAEADDPGEWAEAVPGWLEELLEPDVF